MPFFNFNSKENKLFSITILLSFASIILVTIQTFRKAFRPVGYDLTCYLISAKDFFDGKNPYTIDSIFPFIYPQFFDIVMYPLTFLPYSLAILFWIIIAYISLFFTIKIIIEALNSKSSKFSNILIYFSAINLLMFAILQDNFLNGQVNILLLFLCSLFLKYILEKKIFIASLFLAIPISIKLTPAILIFFLLFQKNFKAIILTSFLTIIFIFGLPFLINGTKSLEYYQYYLDTFILHRTTQGNEIKGFSLSYIFSLINPNIAVLLSALSMIVLNFLNEKFSMMETLNVKRVILFSLYLISILLISPMSEGHHLILILPAYLLIMNTLTQKINRISLAIFIITTVVMLAFKKNDWIVFSTLILLYATLTKLNLSHLKNLKN